MRGWTAVFFIILLIVIVGAVIGYRYVKNSQYVECGIQNCHGPIVCGGTVIHKTCSTIASPEDKCRTLASCQIVEGECHVVEQGLYQECLTCTKKCWEFNLESENDVCYKWCG